MDPYIGLLVVLRSKWNIHSRRLGIVVKCEESPNDVVLVMWTTEDGYKMRYHLKDAIIPVNEITPNKIEERACGIK